MDDLTQAEPAAMIGRGLAAADVPGPEDTVIAQLKLQRRMLFGIELTLVAGVVLLASPAGSTFALGLAVVGLLIALFNL